MENTLPFVSPTEFLFKLDDDVPPTRTQLLTIPKSPIHLESSKLERYSSRFRNMQSQGFGDVKSNHVPDKKCATKYVFKHTTTKSKRRYDPYENIKLIANIKKKMAFAENLDEITKFSCSLKDK